MKKLILILLVPLLLTSTLVSGKDGTVMIKSIEVFGSFSNMKKQLIVIDEMGVTTTEDLSKHNTDGIVENMVLVKERLDVYVNNGYEIISTTATSFGHSGSYVLEHTYILKESP